MGTIIFYEKGTDKTVAYFRHQGVILAIRDLWTKLEFELLKELEQFKNAADAVAAEPDTRERIRTLAQAFCTDLDRLSKTEFEEWRKDFRLFRRICGSRSA